MRIQENNKQKTAFEIKYKHYKYQVIPFKLANFLSSFQVYINKTLVEKLDIFFIVYLENILLYTKKRK